MMLLRAVNMEENKHFVKAALGQTASFADESQRSLVIVSKLKASPGFHVSIMNPTPADADKSSPRMPCTLRWWLLMCDIIFQVIGRQQA